MTPDDKRVDEAAGAAANGDASTGSQADASTSPPAETADDLAGLSAKLPSIAPMEAAGAEDEADLEALAALSAQRSSVVDPEAAATKPAAPGGSSEPASKVAAAAAPAGLAPAAPARGWLGPLLLGICIGAGGATAVFMALPQRGAQPAVATRVEAASPSSAPAITQPEPAREPAAAAPEGTGTQPAAEPSPPAVSGAAAQAALAAPALAAAPPRARAGAAAQHAPAPAAAAAVQPVLAAPAQPPAEPLLPGEEEEREEAAKAARSMDTLLDDALSPEARSQELARRQAAALQSEQLPLTASREEVTRAMTVLLPAIRGCAMGQSGLATAAMVVRSDGKVASVEITGPPFEGTASGRCMEGVIRRARMAPFRQSTMRIRFPLAIQ